MSDLDKAAEEYWFKAKIFNPKKDSLETLAFKAGAMWERNRIAKAWPKWNSDEVVQWFSENLENKTFGDFRHFNRFNDWLRERVLGGAE